MKFAEILEKKGFISGSYGTEVKYDIDYLFELYHRMMKFYKCWIPFDEFCDIPLPLTFSLINQINKDLSKIDPINVIILGYAKKNFRGGGI